MPEEVSSQNEGAAGAGAGAGGDAVVDGGSAAAATAEKKKKKEKEKGKEKWFNEMRGWIMVLAVQVASFTYQAGLNTPSSFSDSAENGSGDVDKDPTDAFRYKVFFYSNTTAFLTSLAIIILLMNRSFYGSYATVTALEIIMVLDMIGLMAAYWAGSTSNILTSKNSMFALVFIALVLFVVYVVYAVQLVQKLWGLFAAAVRRRRRRVRVSVSVPEPEPARAATRDDDDGTLPLPNQQDDIHDTTRAAPPTLLLDAGRSKSSELRRRDSRLLERTQGTGKATMLSP